MELFNSGKTVNVDVDGDDEQNEQSHRRKEYSESSDNEDYQEQQTIKRPRTTYK